MVRLECAFHTDVLDILLSRFSEQEESEYYKDSKD